MLFPTLKLEQQFWKRGIRFVAGVDEVGRGAYAGPIIAATAMIADPRGFTRRGLTRIRDSKTVPEKEREELYERLVESGIVWAVGIIDVARIDVVGIGRANREAIVQAVASLTTQPEHVLLDVIRVRELSLPSTPVIDGDGRVFSIAAASIIAKVTRDRIMRKIHEEYPAYGFTEHKGYGTRAHQTALTKHGPCVIHRRSFVPVRRLSDSAR